MKDYNIDLPHLLQHTSGIKSFTGLRSYRQLMHAPTKHEEIIDRFKDEPFDFAPGEKYKYNNSGYYVLGVIMEMAAEQDYSEFLQKRVFTPLAMTNTYYDTPNKIIPHRAAGYYRWNVEPRNARYVDRCQPFSAGALASTAEDLIHWPVSYTHLRAPETKLQALYTILLDVNKLQLSTNTTQQSPILH